MDQREGGARCPAEGSDTVEPRFLGPDSDLQNNDDAGRVVKLQMLTGCFLVGVALAVTGCGVPDDGWVGVGRDEDGNLRVYLRTCHHPMDGASLSWPDDPNGANFHEEVFAEWTIGPQPDPLRADWPLLGSAPASRVVADRPLTKVPGPPKNMYIFAGTNDNTFSASGPFLFTAADLKKLRPGQVLVDNNTGRESDPPNKTITLSQFDAIDCTQYG